MSYHYLSGVPRAICMGVISAGVVGAGIGVFDFGHGPKAQAAGMILADSVLDFSGTQGTGQGQWQYGYYETPGKSDSFMPLSYDGSERLWEETPTRPGRPGAVPGSSSWAVLTKQGGHPSSYPRGQRWVVRRWISDYAGSVQVSGFFGDVNTNGNVLGRVLLSGVQHQVMESQMVNQEESYSFLATLQLGDRLDFALDPNGPDGHDSARFTAQIQTIPTAVPTPALLPGLIGFGVRMLKQRRRVA